MNKYECDAPKVLYQNFPDENRLVLRQYYYQYKKKNPSNITVDPEPIDTVKEMEKSINKIKDPVKRCENLSRLHNMKLKPITNQSEKTIQELFKEL